MTDEQAVVVVDSQPPAAAMMALVERVASDPEFSVEKLAQLLDVQERWMAGEARRAYADALASFKSETIDILKTSRAKFKLKTGGEMSYAYADLASVCDAVIPALSAHGLSHQWSVSQDGNRVSVTCTLTHRDGHSEHVMLTAPEDTTGQKNAIQQIGSSVTYLQRYTLLSITGLAARGVDDDGHEAHEETRREPPARRERAPRTRQQAQPTPPQPREEQPEPAAQVPAEDAGEAAIDATIALSLRTEFRAAVDAHATMDQEAVAGWINAVAMPEDIKAGREWLSEQLAAHGIAGVIALVTEWAAS